MERGVRPRGWSVVGRIGTHISGVACLNLSVRLGRGFVKPIWMGRSHSLLNASSGSGNPALHCSNVRALLSHGVYDVLEHSKQHIACRLNPEQAFWLRHHRHGSSTAKSRRDQWKMRQNSLAKEHEESLGRRPLKCRRHLSRERWWT